MERVSGICPPADSNPPSLLDTEDFFSRVARATLDVDTASDPDEILSSSAAGVSHSRKASVLVPFFRGDEGPGVLLVRRSDSVSLHKGEICFPGGSIEESDSDALDAALRETYEEIGLSKDDIQIVGRLPAGVTAVSSYLVIPFVGIVPREPEKLAPDPSEVAEVMWVSIFELLREGALQVESRRLGGEERSMYFFHLVSGDVVWGLTARILHDLFVRVGLLGG